MAQMQTVSIRLSDDDLQWLLARQEGGGKTPSEKLRALISQVREQASGVSDPDACAGWMRGLVQPTVNAVDAWERKQKETSDLMNAALDTVPRIMATLISAPRSLREGKSDDFHELEAVLAQQCFRLLISLLRSAVTSVPSVYNRDAIERYLPEIVEITEIITTRKDKESTNV